MHTSEQTDSLSIVNARRTNQTVAATLRAAMTTRDITDAMVSEATHIDLPTLQECLNGTRAFAIADLVNVGGFLSLTPESLLEGVAA